MFSFLYHFNETKKMLEKIRFPLLLWIIKTPCLPHGGFRVLGDTPTANRPPPRPLLRFRPLFLALTTRAFGYFSAYRHRMKQTRQSVHSPRNTWCLCDITHGKKTIKQRSARSAHTQHKTTMNTKKLTMRCVPRRHWIHRILPLKKHTQK